MKRRKAHSHQGQRYSRPREPRFKERGWGRSGGMSKVRDPRAGDEADPCSPS